LKYFDIISRFIDATSLIPTSLDLIQILSNFGLTLDS